MADVAVYMAVESKIGVMVAIFLVSLFAVSFPTLSKQVPFLHIPPLVFFVGKHFGTGVILATAFLHLLDDAFRSLRHPVVENKYGKIGKWTGLVILGSLLTIFLIEYASTTYVEHLRNRPSAPSTPVTSSLPSPKLGSRMDPNTRSPSRPVLTKRPTTVSEISETTPLLLTQQVAVDSAAVQPSSTSIRAASPNKSLTANVITTPATSVPHSRSRPCSPKLVPHAHSHHSHLTHTTHLKPQLMHPVVDFIEILTNSPRICRLGLAGEHQHHHHQHDHEHHGEGDGLCHGNLSRFPSVCRSDGGGEFHDQRHFDASSPTIGRKRQIVSILVLQLGIMIHSLVIGLTLAVAAGSDFTSLTTAIMFHQLFEGLSLGIRIAALPPPEKIHGHNEFHDENGPPDCNASEIVSNIKNYLWPSTCSFSTSPHHCAVRRLFRLKCWKKIFCLKPTLSFLFAVTTPFGMTMGILLFGPGQTKDAASMLLIQGVMSAISAGMLIYAATVEMIAGDFVFGDVDGGHRHHHHEPHTEEGSALVSSHDREHSSHWADETAVQKRGRPHGNGLVVDAEEQGERSVENGIHHPPFSPPPPSVGGVDYSTSGAEPKQSSMVKRVLAVVSLLLGVVMMIGVGMGE